MPIHQQKKRRRRYAAPIGGVFVILAIIGVVTVIVASIRLTSRVLDNAAEKERFTEFIQPVAMFDPSPFEDPSNINMVELLRYGMWATLKSDKRSSYEFDDNVELIVPATDVDVAVARLFGPGIELEHQSFGDFEVMYVYEESENVYIVPIAAQLLVYTPVVEEIEKEGEFFNLTVGYIPPETAWNSNPQPDKYMIYTMRRVGDEYQIAKILDPPVDENLPLDGHQNQPLH